MPTARPAARPEVMDFLLTRRSCPARMLGLPVPDRAQLGLLLQAAARVPDHGKLEPWRFIILQENALARLAGLVDTRAGELGLDADKAEKTRRQFADAALAVAVIATPLASPKVSQSEQVMSSAAACLSLLNAALASGWGANWLTGWMATDRVFLTRGLALESHEFVAGFIHIGTQKIVPPERPRPDVGAKTTWVSE